MKRALILAAGGARGAFQAGVWKFLQEINWKPDLICGSSVGAINAVAIGSGISIEKMIELWKTCDRRHMYKLTIQKFILTFLSRRKFNPPMDTTPLRNLLTEYVNIPALRKSPTEIIITAVNMHTSHLIYFDHNAITIEHIMAAAAMPMLFPWQIINGEAYWDGGIMAATPIGPALKRGIKEIIVVLLSPVGGTSHQPLPKTHHQVGELIFEHFLIGSYNALRFNMPSEDVKIKIISPDHMLGFRSLLNFSPRQAEKLIQQGYENARKQLI